MKRQFRSLVLALALVASFAVPAAFAQSQPNNPGGTSASQPSVDGCHSTAVKTYVALNLSGVATTKIITEVAGKSIQVCGAFYDMGGTTPTLKFIAGTGTTCGTGSVDLTAVMTAGKTVGYGDTAVLQAPIGLAICGVQTGTAPTAVGGFNYVTQ